MVEARGETTLEAKEEVLQEEDEAEVLQMLVVEESIRTQFIKSSRGLINQKSNVIIVRNLVIMDMSAGRNNMTKEGNHMTSNLNLFSSLDDLVKTDVTLGNNVQVTILGKCTVDILMKQGERKYIPDVYHVEVLKHNLLSIGQLI